MTQSKILKQLKQGKLKIYQLENITDATSAKEIRLEYISQLIKKDITEIGESQLAFDALHKKNIENLIGSIEVPLGIAGPIKIIGDNANGKYYVPMATTEGALVASTSRGCKIINACGGVQVTSELIGTTRAPLFEMKSIRSKTKVCKWIEGNMKSLNKSAKTTSTYISLISIKPFSFGKNLWLRMAFDTDQAMGMNMVTKAAKAISKSLESQLPELKLLAISGNMCVDKKASYLNKLLGRGRSINAEIVLKKEAIQDILHISPKKLVEVNVKKTWQGSQMAGSLSNNAHIANTIAAIFVATGQDIAHVIDSSTGSVIFEKQRDDVYIAMRLPSLMIGTLGGGTRLPKQFAAQQIMLTDVSTNKKKQTIKSPVDNLGEILAGAVLAGEISLHAAIAAQDLVCSHQELGKGTR